MSANMLKEEVRLRCIEAASRVCQGSLDAEAALHVAVEFERWVFLMAHDGPGTPYQARKWQKADLPGERWHPVVDDK